MLVPLLVSGPEAVSQNAKNAGSSAKHPGTVYIVLGVDTEPRQSGGDISPELNVAYLADTSDSGNIAAIMRTEWRNRYHDSYGGTPRISWFLITSEQICRQLDCDTVFKAMGAFRSPIKKWQDEIDWHYHNTDYTTVDTGTVFRWNQLITFNGSRYPNGSDIELCEHSLNHLIVDLGFFPTCYRGGWCWENNDFSRWIEDVIPYDLSCYSPKSFEWPTYLNSRSKQFDWSRAPLDWRPFHPDTADYQRPGNMKRYLSRCVVGFTPDDVRLLQEGVNAGHDQLFAWATHSYGNPAQEFDIILGYMTHVCDSLGMKYRFVGATEAFRRVLGVDKQPPPRIALNQRDTVLELDVKGEIFQAIPYVVSVGSDFSFERLRPTAVGRNRWSVVLPHPSPRAVYAAVSNLSGATAIDSVLVAPAASDSQEFTTKKSRRHR